MPRESCNHVRKSCKTEFAQGDVFGLDCIYTMVPSSGTGVVPQRVGCPDGVVVISQTCDSLLSTEVQVARLVTLEGADAREASTGKRPRYLPVRVGGGLKFADLGYVATVDCGCLCSLLPACRGADDPGSQRLFRDLASRRYGRFPFPDDVVAWCRPLREKIAPKARKNGSQGKLLKRIRCIRIEDENNWENPQSYQLTLTFLTEPGAMPTVDEDASYDIPKTLCDALEQLDYSQRATKIADCICNCAEHGLSAGGVCMLWEMLAQTWVAQCNERYGADGHVSRVSGTAEVVPEDEYTFDRMRLSEQLDLDYLSRG